MKHKMPFTFFCFRRIRVMINNSFGIILKVFLFVIKHWSLQQCRSNDTKMLHAMYLTSNYSVKNEKENYLNFSHFLIVWICFKVVSFITQTFIKNFIFLKVKKFLLLSLGRDMSQLVKIAEKICCLSKLRIF